MPSDPRPSKRPAKPGGKQPIKSLHSVPYDRLLQMLRQARLGAGVSQEELAARLGRRQVYVSRCELGERRVDVLEWAELLLAIGVDPHAQLTALLDMIELPRRA